MNPSFFEGKDFTRAHRALHLLKEIVVARNLLFLMEKIARRVPVPFCFGRKMASLYGVSSGNCRSDTIFCSTQKGLEHLKSVIAHTDIIHVVI